MRLIIFLAAAALILLFLWWFRRTPPAQIAHLLRQGALWLGGGLLVLLAATGKLPSLFALLGAGLPFLQRLGRLMQFLPLLQRLLAMGRAARPGQPGQTSEVRTRFLRMRLDHASGALSGEVLEGRYQGRHLIHLDLAQLLELLAECRQDEQSAAVLEAYLDRERSDWRTQADPGEGQAGSTGGFSGPMSQDEALRILGLAPGASAAEILEAHRRLMQKLHPDRGGSTYLATKINQAKDLLLGR